ncbi:MAG: hypothetical protein WA628_01795 [Terriglobales bacterium]
MKWQPKCNMFVVKLLIASVLICMAATSRAETTPLEELIGRANDQVAKFVEKFSDVKCTEHVTQEKLKADGKVELKEESTYDYLVILTNAGGEISLDESRLAVHEQKKDEKKGVSMLVSNGFATLFLVFHPYYSSGFQFTDLGEDTLNGHKFDKVQFKHIPGMRSPAALALRGREYPLDLAGVAWIDPVSGIIGKIDAGLATSMEDIGLKTMRSEVQFQPVPFKNANDVYWFPAQASVEVETPRQHWRNTHNFTDYKQFSVSTEEKVAAK